MSDGRSDTENLVGKVRHPIDNAKLSEYIKEVLPNISLPFELKQFGYGQSNPTYLLTDRTGQKFVLRKKPSGQLLSKTAHAVEREFAVLKALQPLAIPTPKVYTLCRDEAILGTPFYVRQ